MKEQDAQTLRQLPLQAPLALGDSDRDSEFSGLLATLWRRRVAFLVIFLSFTALVAAFTIFVPRSYITTVTMIGGRGSGTASTSDVSGLNVTSIPLLNALLAAGVQSPETYVALARSQTLSQQVIDSLRLRIEPRKLLNHVKVRPLTNTKMLELSVSWSDPQNSALIANQFARVFVEHQRALISRQAEDVLAFLSKQLPSAEAAVSRAESQLRIYQTKTSIADLPTQMQSAIAARAAIESQIVQLNASYRQSEAQLATVRGQIAQTSSTVNGASHTAQNPVAAQLRTRLAEIDTQLGVARKQYTDSHPTVVALRLQQNEVRRALAAQPDRILAENVVTTNPLRDMLDKQAAQLGSEMSGDLSARAALQRELAAVTPALKRMPTQAIRLADLQRNRKLAEDMLTSLQQKYKEATISRTTSLSDVTVTEFARADGAVVQPNPLMVLTLGPVLGMLLGLVGALTLEYFDNSIKDERDLRRQFTLPTLATLPRLPVGEAKALPSVRGMMFESFLRLLMSLRYSSEKPLRTLAVTSPGSGEGKSTIALNAAISMAAVHPSILLIDADMRKPALQKRLGLKNSAGLSDALVGTAQLRDVIQTTKYPGLDFIGSGFAAPNPFALFQSARFGQLLEELGRSYEMIVFDTPPLLPLTDAAMISAKVEGTVLVVAAGETDSNSTKRAVRLLTSVTNANLLGFVLNKVDPDAKDMDYGYYTALYDAHSKSQLLLPVPEGAARG